MVKLHAVEGVNCLFCRKRTLADEANESVETKKKKDIKGTFTDFSAW